MAQQPGATDALCDRGVVIAARQLLATVCTRGGADCPLMDTDHAQRVLQETGTNPAAAITLASDAEVLPHYSCLTDEDYAAMTPESALNRKRDLDVLQRLGLAPGDTRRSRYLYTLLFERIETLDGLCAYDTPGWEGCPIARTGVYESVRGQGWQAMVYVRSPEECAEYRGRNVERIRNGDGLFVRAHHLMCLACWYGGSGGTKPRPNDTLYEVLERVRREPDVPITLVEGVCMACDCCDGYHPESGRCVHAGGLIRDYKKDLDVLQRMGLMPGATLPARDAFRLLFERVPSAMDICGYGDGVLRSEEWRICGGAQRDGYQKARERGIPD